MWSSYRVFALVVLVLLLLVWVTGGMASARERFDTGYNHDLGAMRDYYGPDIPLSPTAAQAASERARYTGAERDPLGLTVYDRVYEQTLSDEHAEQNLAAAGGFAAFRASDIAGMYSPQPATVVNGQTITLSQKTF
jgi:hypothetical protein